MTRPARPALYRDALGGLDGTQAPNLRFQSVTIYWDPTMSTAPRRAPVVARPTSAAPVIVDPSLFVAPAAGSAAPAPAAQPRPIPPAAPIPRATSAAIPRQRPPASAPAAIRPAAPAPPRTAVPPVAWPTPGTSQAWSATGPTVAPVPGTGYSAPVLPVGPPTAVNAPPSGQRPAGLNSQQVLRDAMRSFSQLQQTPQRGANRSTATGKGCASAIFWIVLLVVVGVLLKNGTITDLINQIFH